MTIIRTIKPEERPLLNDFLYEAIFVPAGMTAPPRSIIEQEDLQVYVLGEDNKAHRPNERDIMPW